MVSPFETHQPVSSVVEHNSTEQPRDDDFMTPQYNKLLARNDYLVHVITIII